MSDGGGGVVPGLKRVSGKHRERKVTVADDQQATKQRRVRSDQMNHSTSNNNLRNCPLLCIVYYVKVAVACWDHILLLSLILDAI